MSEQAPTRTVLLAGAGSYATLEVRESEGLYIPRENRNADTVADNFDKISNMENAQVFTNGTEHVVKIVERAAMHKS